MGPFQQRIESEAELRELLGHPNAIVQRKVIHRLDAHCRHFIAQSPLLFAATPDASGACDVSPRGDAPGFVHVVDEQYLVIPERPGNRRMDTYLNLLSNPHIGLIFLIPGLQEVLRINGEACLTQDPSLMAATAAHDKVPKLGIGVKVKECYMHCGKAFIRSAIWNPQEWLDQADLPIPARIIADHVNDAGIREQQVADGLRESYEQRLY
ncbi:hypothetical protein FHS18_002057 [Paenibacillus phyllosphaerae]|uniref:Pyridoxamine 5'-phosphate oxidase N-terminal domain-containing protein n=1 Tax=Paenibacillus phyllosphaerae TaxID=274593 RepID=A0A7W5FMH1_9BACL|nr:pyridoxamine 5'-phosphate oxidase family protein [Paenibacillus phyllosphaerae]MBB3109994.1 hypothetical protein [Paenibacillus phyllosphaerae]